MFGKAGFKKNKKLFINVNLILSKIVDKSVDNFQKKIFNLADNFFCTEKNLCVKKLFFLLFGLDEFVIVFLDRLILKRFFDCERRK